MDTELSRSANAGLWVMVKRRKPKTASLRLRLDISAAFEASIKASSLGSSKGDTELSRMMCVCVLVLIIHVEVVSG